MMILCMPFYGHGYTFDSRKNRHCVRDLTQWYLKNHFEAQRVLAVGKYSAISGKMQI